MGVKLKKTAALISLLLVVIVAMTSFTACDERLDMSFERRCKTSADGFVYYEDKSIGLCVISLPDGEDIVIPEYIDGKQVKQLGYKEVAIGVMRTHMVDGSKVKNLTIQHSFDSYAVSFPNIDTLIYVDFPYCVNSDKNKSVWVMNGIGVGPYEAMPNVKLVKSLRNIDLSRCTLQSIYIPNYVMEIDTLVFDGLTDVSIKTSYETKPQGWQNEWNGNCVVEWGVQL